MRMVKIMKVPVVPTAGVKPDTVANVNNLTSNLSPQEVETEGPGGQGHLRLGGQCSIYHSGIICDTDGH